MNVRMQHALTIPNSGLIQKPPLDPTALVFRRSEQLHHRRRDAKELLPGRKHVILRQS